MRRLAVLGLAVALGVADGAAAQDSWSDPAPGIRLLRRTAAGPRRIRALVVDLCEPAIAVRATRSGERRQTVSAWGRDVGAEAAVNGDFFSFETYATTGLSAGNGIPWTDTSDDGWKAVFAYGPRGDVQLRTQANVLDALTPWMYEVVSGAPTVVEAGVARGATSSHFGQLHPRTGLGLSEDGHTLYLVTIDGRSSSSVGATVLTLGQVLAGLGAHRAINLDGGGSTAMWVRGTGVVNTPSDGSERVVANHLGVVVRDVDPGEPSFCCESSDVTDPSPRFSDVPADSGLARALEGLGDDATGCGGGHYCGGCRATRAFAIAMLVRASGREPLTPATASWSDAPTSSSFFGEIERATADGITGGCGAGRVCAERPVTRAELAVFAARAMALSRPAPTSAPYDDVPIDHGNAPAIAAVTAACLMGECRAGRFCPSRTATRREIALVAARAAGVVSTPCDPEPEPDAGVPSVDAGSIASDAGMTSATDAGMSIPVDAGGPELPRVDASGAVGGEDAGTWEESPSLSGGCAIEGRRGNGAWALIGLALLVTWRRRASRRHRRR